MCVGLVARIMDVQCDVVGSIEEVRAGGGRSKIAGRVRSLLSVSPLEQRSLMVSASSD